MAEPDDFGAYIKSLEAQINALKGQTSGVQAGSHLHVQTPGGEVFFPRAFPSVPVVVAVVNGRGGAGTVTISNVRADRFSYVLVANNLESGLHIDWIAKVP